MIRLLVRAWWTCGYDYGVFFHRRIKDQGEDTGIEVEKLAYISWTGMSVFFSLSLFQVFKRLSP